MWRRWWLTPIIKSNTALTQSTQRALLLSWLAGDARNLLLTYNGDEESCLPLVDAMANGKIDDVDERNVEAEESHDVADADEQEPEVLQQREVHHLLQCVLAALRHTQVAPGLKHIQN